MHVLYISGLAYHLPLAKPLMSQNFRITYLYNTHEQLLLILHTNNLRNLLLIFKLWLIVAFSQTENSCFQDCA